MPINRASMYRILLADQLLPVQAFFNCLPDSEFLSAMEEFIDGVSFDYNGVGCTLPTDSEDVYDAPVTGVSFYVCEEEVWLSNKEVFPHFKAALTTHMNDYPLDKEKTENIIILAKKALT